MQDQTNITARSPSRKIPAPESANTQRAKILGRLIEARGQEVPLYELSSLACQYGARIFELRRLGFKIVNRTEEVDGVRRSWFRLASSPVQASTPPTHPAAECDPSNSQTDSAGAATSDPAREQFQLFPTKEDR